MGIYVGLPVDSNLVGLVTVHVQCLVACPAVSVPAVLAVNLAEGFIAFQRPSPAFLPLETKVKKDIFRILMCVVSLAQPCWAVFLNLLCSA